MRERVRIIEREEEEEKIQDKTVATFFFYVVHRVLIIVDFVPSERAKREDLVIDMIPMK